MNEYSFIVPMKMNPKQYFLTLGVILLFLGFVLLFSLNSTTTLHFGAGIVDVFYCFGIGILEVILLVYLLDNIYYKTVKVIELQHYEILVFYVIMSLLIFLKFTFLRGSMSPWNGQIFF